LKREPLGKARLTSVDVEQSQAAWLTDDSIPKQATAVQLLETERPTLAQPLVVFIPEGKGLDPWAKVLADTSAPKIEVVRATGPRVEYQLFHPNCPEHLELWTVPDAFSLWRGPVRCTAELVESLRDRFGNEARYRALMQLGTTPGNVQLQLHFRKPT